MWPAKRPLNFSLHCLSHRTAPWCRWWKLHLSLSSDVKNFLAPCKNDNFSFDVAHSVHTGESIQAIFQIPFHIIFANPFTLHLSGTPIYFLLANFLSLFAISLNITLYYEYLCTCLQIIYEQEHIACWPSTSNLVPFAFPRRP